MPRAKFLFLQENSPYRAKLVWGDIMAKVYRKHRYSGIKLGLRKLGRGLVSFSRFLAPGLFLLYLLLPWLLPLERLERAVLLTVAILSGIGAYIWVRRVPQVAKAMDILAAGHDGEGEVAKALAKLPRDWAVLNDLALRVQGPIVQIDHIVVSPTGVYVLETKTQKGEIISTPEGDQWQVKRRGQVRSIANPILQNRTQVQACTSLLDKLGVHMPCTGLVVMTRTIAQAKGITVPLDNLNAHFNQIASKEKPVLTPRQVRKLAKELLTFQVRGRASWQKEQGHWRVFTMSVLAPLLLYALGLAVFIIKNRS